MTEHGTTPWRDLVERYDPTAHGHMTAYIGHVIESSPLAPKHRELMLFATSATVRYRSSMLTHGRRALEAGASIEELFSAVAMAALSGGFTCMIEGVGVLEELSPR